MEVNDFQILLIGVTFYLQRVQKLVLNVLIKIILKNLNIICTGGQSVKCVM